MTRKRLLIALFAVAFLGFAGRQAPVEAQRPGPGPHGHVAVGVGVGYQVGWGFWGGYGPYGPWGPWWGGPWGPWGGYGYYGYYGGSIRIQVKPKETEVYVDGWRAGVVDDFDSWYQALNLSPGGHEIALYLEGYRTQRHQVYFANATSQHLKGVMEKLEAGESSGPRPQPAPRTSDAAGSGRRRAPRAEPPPDEQPVAGQQVAGQPARVGSLSLKVQPGDATVLVDNQPWVSSGVDQRLTIKLTAGRHHLEVKKDGFEPYVEDILIRADATMTLNVGLAKKQ